MAESESIETTLNRPYGYATTRCVMVLLYMVALPNGAYYTHALRTRFDYMPSGRAFGIKGTLNCYGILRHITPPEPPALTPRS